MLVLISKSTGKPFALESNGHTMTAQKTIKTATVYPDHDLSALKNWIHASGADDSVDVRFMQSTCVEDAYLERYGAVKYNNMKSACNIIQTIMCENKGQ